MRHIASMIIRVMALFFFVTVLSSLAALLGQYLTPVPTELIHTAQQQALVYMGVNLLLSVILWISAPKLAALMVPGADQSVDISVTAQELAYVGCCLIGLYIVIDELPTVVGFVLNTPYWSTMQLLTGLLPMALAILLIVNARRVSAAVSRA